MNTHAIVIRNPSSLMLEKYEGMYIKYLPKPSVNISFSVKHKKGCGPVEKI